MIFFNKNAVSRFKLKVKNFNDGNELNIKCQLRKLHQKMIDEIKFLMISVLDCCSL